MRKLLEHPAIVALVTLAAAIFIISNQLSTHNQVDIDSQARQLEELMAQKERNITALEEKIALSSDPFIKEKQARDELLLQKPGEVPLQLPPMTPLPLPTPVPTTTPTPWQEWKALIF